MDSLELVKTVVGIAKDAIEALAVIVGGWWTYNRFVRNRLDHAHIGFDLGLRFIAKQGDNWLVEVEAELENKGSVRQQLYQFEFRLRYLNRTDALKLGSPDILKQVDVKHLAAQGPFFKDDWKYAFLEPGTKQRFTHVAKLPVTASSALVWSRFKYLPDADADFHTAQRLFVVPEALPVSPAV
jgi:hypothetical protein